MANPVRYLSKSDLEPSRWEATKQRPQQYLLHDLNGWNPKAMDSKEKALRLASRVLFVALQAIQILLPLAMHYLPTWSTWGVIFPSMIGLTIGYMYLNYELKKLTTPLKKDKEMRGYLRQVFTNPHESRVFPLGQWEAKQMDERCRSDIFALKQGIKQIHPDAADVKRVVSHYNLDVDSLRVKEIVAERLGGVKNLENEWDAIRLAVKQAKQNPDTYPERMREIEERALAVQTGGVVDFDFPLKAQAKTYKLETPKAAPPKTTKQRYADLKQHLRELRKNLVSEKDLEELLEWNEKHPKLAHKPILHVPPKEKLPKAILDWCEKSPSWKEQSAEDFLMAQLRMWQQVKDAKAEFALLDKNSKVSEIEQFEKNVMGPLDEYIANKGHTKFEAFQKGVFEGLFGSRKPVASFFTPEQKGLNPRLLTADQREEWRIDQKVQAIDTQMVRIHRAKVLGIDLPLQLLVVVEAIFWMYVPSASVFWGFALVNVVGITASYLLQRRFVQLEQEKQSAKLQYRLRHLAGIEKVPGASTQLNRLQKLEKSMGLEGVHQTWGHLLVHGDQYVPEPKSVKAFDRQKKKLAEEVEKESSRYLKGRYEGLKAYFQTDPLGTFQAEYNRILVEQRSLAAGSKESVREKASLQLMNSMKLGLLNRGCEDFFEMIAQLFNESLQGKKERKSEVNPTEILALLKPDFANKKEILSQLKTIPKKKLKLLQNQIQTDLCTWLDQEFDPLVKTSIEAGKRGLEKMLKEMLSLSIALEPPQTFTKKNKSEQVSLRLTELLGEEQASKVPKEWRLRISKQIPLPKKLVSPSEEERKIAKSEILKKRKEERLEEIAEQRQLRHIFIAAFYNTGERIAEFKRSLPKESVMVLTEPVSPRDLFFLREALQGGGKRKSAENPAQLLTQLHLGKIDDESCMARLKEVPKKKLWELGHVLNALFKLQKDDLKASPSAIQEEIFIGEEELFGLFLERCALTMDKKVLDRRLKRLFDEALSGEANLESKQRTLPLFLMLKPDCSNPKQVGRSLKQCRKEEIEALQNYCGELTDNFYRKWESGLK